MEQALRARCYFRLEEWRRSKPPEILEDVFESFALAIRKEALEEAFKIADEARVAAIYSDEPEDEDSVSTAILIREKIRELKESQ